jgi:sporulation protein YtfJ
MDKHPIGDLMETTMQKIREMIDVNTIIGSPIVTAEGMTLIPISKVSFGFASGGSDFQTKHQQATNNSSFGRGSGAGVNIVPVAFLVVRGTSVKLLNITPPASSTVDRIIEMVPEVIDKVNELFNKEEEC